jgi:hypothetical protein
VMFLTRKALYYMMNQVFPGFLLNLVTLLSFFLPPQQGSAIVMSGFITFGVYSVNMANTLPTQSDYITEISNYFLSSIALNLIAFAWYIFRNHCLLRNEMPNWLKKFGELVKKMFCLCFPPDDKKDKNESSNKKSNEDTPKTNSTDLSIVVYTGDTKNNDLEKKSATDKLNAPILDSDKLAITEKAEKEGQKEEKKCECGFCDRCTDCEAEFKKDKDKGKLKKEIETCLEALNYLAFVIMLFTLLMTNILIWINIIKS